jgi:hypothetical protein
MEREALGKICTCSWPYLIMAWTDNSLSLVNQNADSRYIFYLNTVANSLPDVFASYSFFGSVAVGTPPVAYDVILDTGSSCALLLRFAYNLSF